MRRRQFLVFAGAVALASPAGAQSSGQTRRIAIFHLSGRNDVVSESGSASWRAFFAELRKWGFVEGRNLVIDRYAAESGHHLLKGLSDLLAGEPRRATVETVVRGSRRGILGRAASGASTGSARRGTAASFGRSGRARS